MNMSSGWTARLVVPVLALVLGGCLNGGGEEAAPEPPSPNPPQAVNTPPNANAGADQVVAPGATVNLDGSASSDSNGTIATYAWTQTAGSAVTLASAGTASTSFAAPTAAGTLTFQLTVTDNGGASHSDTVTVTVNAIPVASAGADQTVSAGAAVTLTGSATDEDGTIASYAWAQTSGPAVTLTNGSSASASFTAPSAAATLVFSLTVTDDRGATHFDSVSVTVTAGNSSSAPAIARHPNNPIALEHGSAMMFVAASGNDLTYEWRRSSGTVVKTGPEPFLLVTNLFLSQNDDCYYVVISNASGAATSNEGCLTVEEIDWHFDPSDDNQNDDWAYASGYGNMLFTVAQMITGPFTGTVGFAAPAPVRLGFPLNSGPPEPCHIGSYGGLTIDGVMMTANEPLPIGHHVISESWDDCYESNDDTDPDRGAYMVEYDFPEVWGVGTITLHVSRDYFNGTVHANVQGFLNDGFRSEEIEITFADDFSAGDMKASPNDSISVDRRYTSDGLKVDDAYVNFQAILSIFDDDGGAGLVSGSSGGFHLHQNFGEGDEEIEQFTWTGYVDVSTTSYHLARLEPSGADRGWSLHPVPEEECPADTCAEPPTP